jgi:GTP-binding protein HflX
MALDFEKLGSERPATVVVAVQLPGVDDGELMSSIAELERLAKTLGLDPIARVTQRRAKLAPGVVLGEGKLKELADWTGGTGEVPMFESMQVRRKRLDQEALEADDDEDEEEEEVTPGEKPTARAKVVLVDHDLSPTQHSNLEKATGVEVLDRTGVILEIFHRHAKTREARMQVEIARLRYLDLGCAKVPAAVIACAVASAARGYGSPRKAATDQVATRQPIGSIS